MKLETSPSISPMAANLLINIFINEAIRNDGILGYKIKTTKTMVNIQIDVIVYFNQFRPFLMHDRLLRQNRTIL